MWFCIYVYRCTCLYIEFNYSAVAQPEKFSNQPTYNGILSHLNHLLCQTVFRVTRILTSRQQHFQVHTVYHPFQTKLTNYRQVSVCICTYAKFIFKLTIFHWPFHTHIPRNINPLTTELNPSPQHCLTRFFTGDFAFWTVHFVNIRMKNQQIHQLFIQFINYVW
jgi:hypothetical protein